MIFIKIEVKKIRRRNGCDCWGRPEYDDISCILEEVKHYRDKISCENNSKLPRTNCNIPMPNVKPPASNGDRICDTCNKEDVCMYKGELAQAAKEITQISERVNVFIDTDIRCKKWSGKVVNTRDTIPLEERIKWLEEDYVTGKGR